MPFVSLAHERPIINHATAVLHFCNESREQSRLVNATDNDSDNEVL